MDTTPQSDLSLRRQAAIISLIVGFCMLLMKLGAYYLTHSAAIFSDAIESVVHVAATSMAFYSIILSSRPPDESHPYGHGKIEFFSAGIEGGLIVLAAVVIVYEAIKGIVFGRELVSLDTGMLITLAASLINLFLGMFLIRRGKATNSLTLIADGKHVLTDSYTSFGVVTGIGLVMLTGIQILDPIAAIAVALNIIWSGYKLMRISVGGLMDETDAETLAGVGKIVEKRRTTEWINIHHLRVLRSGQMQHVDFHLTIPHYWSVSKAHEFQHQITDAIAADLNESAKVMIHLDPCVATCCPLCSISPCDVRNSAFKAAPSWTVPSLIADPPYKV